MRPLLILFAFVAVAVGTFALRANLAPPNRALETELPLPDRIAAERQRPAQVDLRQRPLRNQVELPAGAQGTTTDSTLTIEDRGSRPVENAALEAQYAGWSSERLAERLDALESAHLAEVERLSNLRFEAGLYRVVGANELEGLDESYDVLAEFDKQGVLTRARSVLVEPAANAPVADDDSEPEFQYQIVSLPPETFPELYRQRTELDWLRATLAARSAASEDQR